ncbi:MAG: ThiF family adenylyltransferase [Nannocystaceae bacterium]|nr:ThiF family adenylyltransferase [Nannocystaceae bacterium]
MTAAEPRYVVLGAGGLGCPALLGLRMAGATRVDIVDHDRVDASNLARQVLYDLGDVGARKAEVAARRLRAAGIDARAHVRRIPLDRPEALAALLDELGRDAIVLECTDAPALKFACNDALVAHGGRGVIGAALGLRGQAIAVQPGSACYRCVYEAPPPAELLPTCAQAGVLGPAVGSVGFFMATLAVALANGGADEAAGRLFVLELGSGIIRPLAGRPRPGCSCGRAHAPAACS